MTGFLFETIAWTGALIGLVLLVRRPVARWFGPQVAYALWALPLLRVVMPPIELPAWLAPTPGGVSNAAGLQTTVVWTQNSVPAASQAAAPLVPLSLAEIALAAWASGALIFLYRRFSAYFAMRRDMLAEASDVGRAGDVRLVETPATNAPLAFGVLDRVIALSPGFMARFDRTARDLALRHELAHHAGHDLLVNMLAQPLFAMHWFNPLGHYGWQALRRDQEAACDARVIAHAGAQERSTYAAIIANFAAGPRVALAAPMACPVLGDKSIIQRLRSLNMSDIPARRLLAGRAMLAAALVALPLTASITYAETRAAPEAPSAPAAPGAPVAPLAPQAPQPPAAPLALQAAPEAPKTSDEDVRIEVIEDEDVIVEDGETKRVKKVRVINRGDKMSREEMDEIMREVREGLDEAGEALAEAQVAKREALIELRRVKDGEGETRIEVSCDDSDAAPSNAEATMVICDTDIYATALEGLRGAREGIAGDSEMPAEIKAEVLRSIDAKIAEWEERNG